MGISMGMEAGTQTNRDPLLELRLLGDFQIVSKGRETKLPASRKTRALAAYLVATGIPHRREWLCDLLWEGPDDPRGELRWSLAKIRPLLDAGQIVRLKTDRSRVGFEASKAIVDLTTVRDLLADIPNASPETLKTAIALFRGEFLDGLELPACYRFQEWCLAERSALSALRLSAHRALVDQLNDRPEEALVHARGLVVADPLSEDGHARVIHLLARLGRRREALAQYQQARGMLEREAGTSRSGALDRARYTIGRTGAASIVLPKAAHVEDGATASSRTAGTLPLVGRAEERAQIDQLVSAAANGRVTPVLLVTGEPGIGKSRLLDHLSDRAALVGGRCLRGRAFEAEAAHPYGAWIDALRTVPTDTLPKDAQQHLALLRPGLDPPPAPTDRARFFDAVVALLRQFARVAPLAVVLDDVQWLDDASSALLHYVARQPYAPEAVLFVCAARSGELADNPAVSRSLRALQHDERVLELPLAALSKAETTELVRSVDAGIDAAAVYAESDGNPLFALELSQGHREGRHQPGRSLQAVIAGQFATLDEHCRSLLTWASALGRTFDPGLLARLTELQSAALLAALERLERRGIVRAADTHSYEFAHDLVRGAAYQQISHPRRKLMHGQIASILDALVATSDDVAGDLMRHAELAGDYARAARACVIAGERSLRLFANADAMALAGRGHSHLDRLPDSPLRRELVIGLFKIQILAATGPGLRPHPSVVEELTKAIAAAEAVNLYAAAATGHYILSVVHQEMGATTQARQSTLRAAEVGRGADRQTFAQQLANTARCLIELEVEIPRARSVLAEAKTLLGPKGQLVCELQWGLGLLERWAGNICEATTRVECALSLARNAEDRWRQYKCVTWLAVLEFERGRFSIARDRCQDLRVVAEQLGESAVPFADTLDALANLAESSSEELDRLDAALSGLRAVDDKSHLAYALNAAVVLCLGRQLLQAAKAYAEEALDVARTMQRQGEIAIAEAMLAVLDTGRSANGIQKRLGRLRKQVADQDRFNARARTLVGQAVVIGIPCSPMTPLSSVNGKHRRRR